MLVRKKTTIKPFRDWLVGTDIMRSVYQLCFISIGLMMHNNDGDKDDNTR
jgi:hypothetical protein